MIESPNRASIQKRLASLRGRAPYIQEDVRIFYSDCVLPDLRQNPAILRRHWREYTAEEIRQVLEWEGFRINSCITYDDVIETEISLRHLPAHWLMGRGTGVGILWRTIVRKLIKQSGRRFLVIGQKANDQRGLSNHENSQTH